MTGEQPKVVAADQTPPPPTTPTGPARPCEGPIRHRQYTAANAELIEAGKARRAEVEAQKRARELAENARVLWAARGKRYERCTLDNFVAGSPDQQKVVRRVRVYAEHIERNINRGVGVVLIGPPGTGKDHLMAALMHAALAAGKTIKWASGPQLFAGFRDDIGADTEERRALAQYTKPDVFALSDPTWEQSRLERFQRAKLMEIIDGRYNHLRATWVTLNVKDRDQANNLIGGAIVDRLVDGALSLECNWPSYRKSAST